MKAVLINDIDYQLFSTRSSDKIRQGNQDGKGVVAVPEMPLNYVTTVPFSHYKDLLLRLLLRL